MPDLNPAPREHSFIPARESGWFIFIFDLYTRFLFRRHFKNILIDQEYQPGPNSKTIYYLNHTSWWDGLIPLLLNRKLFRQKARALMEEKQMKKFGFFKKIGAFSVHSDDSRSAARSLQYALRSLERDRACLFIYPEGKIVPFSAEPSDFMKGLGWLSNRCPAADVVPVGIFQTTARSRKPELFIKIGRAVRADHSLDSDTLTIIFEKELGKLLKSLRLEAHRETQNSFKKLF